MSKSRLLDRFALFTMVVVSGCAIAVLVHEFSNVSAREVVERLAALPAGIDLEDRAARMNAFWDALVDLQYRDVIVVALAVGEER